jgi:hypothetical protein
MNGNGPNGSPYGTLVKHDQSETKRDIDTPLDAPAPTPVPLTVPSAPADARGSPAPPPVHPDDGFKPVGRSWNTVARMGIHLTGRAIQGHENVAKFTKIASTAQGRTPQGNLRQGAVPPPIRTEVTVSRQGVFLEGGAEDVLRSRNAESIVMEVRTAIASQTKNPLRLLGGHWSVNSATTGNFVYTIAGDVPPQIIMTFSKWLCAPFPKAHLIPKTGWTWAQLRGVPVYNDTGVIWAPDDLFVEVHANLIFDNVTFCMPPRWQVPPEHIMTDLSTVQVAFVDIKGEVAKQATTMASPPRTRPQCSVL